MVFKSIRWRIQLWHGGLLFLLVSGLLATFYVYERAARLREIDEHLQAILPPFLPAVTFNPDDRPPLPPEFQNGRLYYVVWSPEQNIAEKSANTPQLVPAPEPGVAFHETASPLRTRGEFRELIHYGPDGSIFLIGESIAAVQGQLFYFGWELAGLGVVFVMFGLAGGWWAAGQALKPIAEISTAAGKIASGKLEERIALGETESELGQLATVLNRTFDRLNLAFEQQMRFTADASHELRTPISVILTRVQLALSRERNPEEYRETLKVCEQTAERMRTLVNGLLELARADSGELALRMEECDLGRIARDSLEFISPIAKQKGATLHHALESVKTKADVFKLGQVLVNLLQNAIQHNRAGVEVSLTVRQTGTKAVITVSDNGVGIPQDALEHIFDRFYRGDKSRSRLDKGGTGLGLAIAKNIIDAHGGTICAVSKPGTGAEFIIELPLQK